VFAVAAWAPTRLVRYPDIDRGRTRMEYNAALRPANRVTMEDRPKVRVGEAPREPSPFPGSSAREAASRVASCHVQPAGACAWDAAGGANSSSPATGKGFSEVDAGRGAVADGAPFKNKQEERERSAIAQASELPPKLRSYPLRSRP
jgi:hypothetical protein